MSYIRCLSNPERLYAFDRAPRGGSVDVWVGQDLSRVIPRRVFEGLLIKWLTTGRGNTRHLGASLQERDGEAHKGKDFKWEFAYKDWPKPIRLWEVTLFYLATNAARYKRARKKGPTP